MRVMWAWLLVGAMAPLATGCSASHKSCEESITESEDVLRSGLAWLPAVIGAEGEMWCDDSASDGAYLIWDDIPDALLKDVELGLQNNDWVGPVTEPDGVISFHHSNSLDGDVMLYLENYAVGGFSVSAARG
ncbi:MAG: hypothetical protein ACREQ3_21930 [Candidatus Binatia bacterium]